MGKIRITLTVLLTRLVRFNLASIGITKFVHTGFPRYSRVTVSNFLK